MELDAFRNEIDACDREIVQLLNRRAKAAQEIGRRKHEHGAAVFAPAREKAVYDKVVGVNTGPLTEGHLHNIYREIMSACIALEAPTRISFLGPKGTFSHEAAMHKFGGAMEYLPALEIRDVFLAVTRGHADYGVVPIENSTEGGVSATADMLMEMDPGLTICSEIFLPVHHNLLYNGSLDEIQVVISHPQALAQCRNWLAANLPGVPTEPVPSTATAAEQASYKRGVAAISSEVAMSIYTDLEHIERGIEDKPDNTTRFIVIGRHPAQPTGDDRTSVLFSIRHESGSLVHALAPFDREGVNMTRIESRPAKKVRWEYSFFVDLEGHQDEPRVQDTLEEVRRLTDDFRVLGSYPRAAHVVFTPPSV